MLFGLPIVATQAMAVDKFLVGNFAAAATLYDRWTPRVEVSTEHSDFFVKNPVAAILAEVRIGLAVRRPAALTYGISGSRPERFARRDEAERDALGPDRPDLPPVRGQPTKKAPR